MVERKQEGWKVVRLFSTARKSGRKAVENSMIVFRSNGSNDEVSRSALGLGSFTYRATFERIAAVS